MSQKRVPLSERRLQDRRGIDALIQGGEEAASPARPAGPAIAKVTLYVRADQVAAIEEIQLHERRRTGKKPDKSELVQEALDLLIGKYSNTA